jgi:hypothetical protein
MYMASKITGSNRKKIIVKMSGPETLSLQVKLSVVKLNSISARMEISNINIYLCLIKHHSIRRWMHSTTQILITAKI